MTMACVLADVDTNRVLQKCSCSKLTENDIPGATLSTVPEKCRVTDLRVWLKCRGQKVKSKENKAELCVRVKKCVETGAVFDITDPYPGQPYLEKKKSACPNCQTKTRQQNSKETETETVNWTKDAKCLPETFNYVNILDYSKLSGKKTKDIVENPLIEDTLYFLMDMFMMSLLVQTQITLL